MADAKTTAHDASAAPPTPALNDMPTITGLAQRVWTQPYAEVQAGAFLTATAVALVVWARAACGAALAHPVLALVAAAAWFAALRALARGRACPLPATGAVDLTGQTVCVTGGASGIGYANCVQFARLGAQLILGVRGAATRGEDLAARVARDAGVAVERVTVFELDLSSGPSVRAFARAVLAENKPLAVLLNNAALGPLLADTADGRVDALVNTNHGGPMLLTLLLLPALRAHRGPNGTGARVVNVSSGATDLVPNGLAVADLLSAAKAARLRIDPMAAYAHSKLCNVAFTVELQRRLDRAAAAAAAAAAAGSSSSSSPPPRVTAYSVHPGSIYTRLLRRESAVVQRALAVLHRLVFKTADGGAQTSLYCAVHPSGGPTGPVPGWFHADCRPCAVRARPASDTAYYAEFWETSLKLIDPNGELPAL